MHRQLVLAAVLTLSACASVTPSPPSRSAISAAVPPPRWSPPASYDLRVSALPARPAGAAFAAAGEEHALVRRNLVVPAVPAPVLATTLQPPPSKNAAGDLGLAAQVLEVHAAYRRWCVGASLPEDDVLLAGAGGLRLPGAVACERPTTSSRPTGLFPDPG